jgi:hypothetical protein
VEKALGMVKHKRPIHHQELNWPISMCKLNEYFTGASDEKAQENIKSKQKP